MATYDLKIFTADAFGGASVPPNWSGVGDAVFGNGDGAQWRWAVGTSFQVQPKAITTVTINDSDRGSAGSSFDDYDSTERGQVIESSSEPGRFPHGLRVENEYEVTFTDGTNEYRMVAISSGSQIIGYTFDGAWPPADAQLQVVPDSWADYQSMVPCFVAGALIETARGLVAIENVAPGDMVTTRDHGMQPVRWVGSRQLTAVELARNPKLRPIRIKTGALGEGRPFADLLVSQQHRVLVRSRIAQRMFGTDEVLVAAKQLLQLDGIEIADDLTQVKYVHILFDRHEIVLSNGAETESLYTGKEALKAVGPAARDEIFALFPELRTMDGAPVSARPLSPGGRARKLAARHTQHGRPLVS